MKVGYLVLLIISISCSSIKYGTIKPADKPIDKWKKPTSQSKIDKMFYLAEGLQTYPYVIINDLGDGLRVYYYAFDYKAEEDSYKQIKRSIKSKFSLSSNFIERKKIDLPEPSKSYTLQFQEDKEIVNLSLAIVPHKDKGLVGILIFDTANNGQKTHNDILSTVAYHGIPSKIVTPFHDTSIKVGKHYRRVFNSDWMDIRNISSYPDGQMNWSLNSTLQGAENRVKTQFERITANDNLSIIQDDSIDIMFFNRPAKMRRVILTIESLMFSLFVPSSNVLYSYYVASKIDSGMYINWVGSHYEHQASSRGLSTLLGEVISYKNKPKSRIISSVKFPSLDTLKNYLEEKIAEPLHFSQESISNEEISVEISTEYIDTMRFTLFTKPPDSSTISIVQNYLKSISSDNSESAKIVRESLEKTKTIVQFEYLSSDNKIENLIYSFCGKRISGIYQIDYRGFYVDGKLAYRLK